MFANQNMMVSTRWVVAEVHELDEEPDPIGFVHAVDASSAVATARAQLGDSALATLVAIPWESASPEQRQAAEEEHRYREQAITAAVQPVVGVVMIGIGTALVADYPTFQRSLSLALDDDALNRLFTAYLIFLCYCVERQTEISALGRLREPFLLALRTEIARRFFPGAERADGVSVLDDLLSASKRDFEGCVYPSSATTPAGNNLLFRFGEVVSGIVGRPGDNEIVGPVMIQIKGTLDRLQLGSALVSLGPSNGAPAV